MSSTVNIFRLAASLPTVPSKTSLFFSWSCSTRSSTVPSAMNLTARMGLYWPSLWVLSMACISAAGFHHGSNRYASFATVRFRATPPAFRLIRRTRTDGSSLNAVSASSRDCTFIPPWTMRTPRPRSWRHGSETRRHRQRSSIEVNCEKTRALLPGRSFLIPYSSSTSDSSFVDVENSARLILRRIEPLATFLISFSDGIPAVSFTASVPLSTTWHVAWFMSMLKGARQDGQRVLPRSTSATAIMSTTQPRQKAELQQLLRTRSVGVSSQSWHSVVPLATAGRPRAANLLWFFLEWTIIYGWSTAWRIFVSKSKMWA
mmetsp:Transcript_16680/g.34361  ORF Transcript_16680/g.34361 Transcript_16680/m.34361 type:complete len:317 (-) Transcript_16680:342-1292(-)